MGSAASTASEPELTLYNFPLSNCGNLVKWYLQYNKIPFREVVIVIPAKEHRSKEFLKDHPFGKLPILKDSSQGKNWEVCESFAILQYLALKHPSPLLPAVNAKACGEVSQALEIIHHDAWLHANHGQWHVVTEPLVYAAKPDMDVVAKEHGLLMKALKELESFYFKESPNHVLGTTDTVADFALADCLSMNQMWSFNRGGVDLTKVPKVHAFLKSIQTTAHFQQLFAPVEDFLVTAIAKGDKSHPGGMPGLKQTITRNKDEGRLLGPGDTRLPRKGKLTLYNFPLSNCGNLIKWYLQYNNIPFEELIIVIPEKAHRSKDFLMAHPFGKLPVLKDTAQGESWEIVESFAILQYLARQYPSKLLPLGTDIRACGEVSQALEVIHHDAWLHANHGQWHVVTEPLVYATKPDMAIVAKVHGKLMKALKELESVYFKDSPDHVVGTTDTPADLALADCLSMNQMWSFNRAGVDLTQVPKVHAFLKSMQKTDHFQKLFAPVEDFLVSVIAKGDKSHPGGMPGLKQA